MNYRIVAGVALAVLLLIFIVQNTAVVGIHFLFWKLEMSRSLLMFFILAAGVVIGWFLHGHYMKRG